MFTLQFIPYSEIEGLNSQKRISKLLKLVKENRIVLLQGKLKKKEETELIQKTMEEIDENFKGIELAVIEPELKEMPTFRKMKNKIINMLIGSRAGFTVVGPANLVSEIKQDPNKIHVMLNENVLKEEK
jgi:hypothetical protein